MKIRESDVQTMVAAGHFDAADDAIEDAVGLIKSADLASAVLSARRAFDLTIDGLLAHCGEFAPSEKWRARKLARAKPAQIGWEEFWDMQTMQGV